MSSRALKRQKECQWNSPSSPSSPSLPRIDDTTLDQFVRFVESDEQFKKQTVDADIVKIITKFVEQDTTKPSTLMTALSCLLSFHGIDWNKELCDALYDLFTSCLCEDEYGDDHMDICRIHYTKVGFLTPLTWIVNNVPTQDDMNRIASIFFYVVSEEMFDHERRLFIASGATDIASFDAIRSYRDEWVKISQRERRSKKSALDLLKDEAKYLTELNSRCSTVINSSAPSPANLKALLFKAFQAGKIKNMAPETVRNAICGTMPIRTVSIYLEIHGHRSNTEELRGVAVFENNDGKLGFVTTDNIKMIKELLEGDISENLLRVEEIKTQIKEMEKRVLDDFDAVPLVLPPKRKRDESAS